MPDPVRAIRRRGGGGRFPRTGGRDRVVRPEAARGQGDGTGPAPGRRDPRGALQDRQGNERREQALPRATVRNPVVEAPQGRSWIGTWQDHKWTAVKQPRLTLRTRMTGPSLFLTATSRPCGRPWRGGAPFRGPPSFSRPPWVRPRARSIPLLRG